MTTGVVTNVTPRRSGGTLTATTTAADEVLLIDDAADFDEDFESAQWLVIGDESTPREYVAVANDEEAQQSVALASAVGAVFEDGLPVTPWDPDSQAADKRAVEYQAWVRLDDQGKPIPASLRHSLIPLSGTAALVGASVRIERDEHGGWFVVEVTGREPVLDQSVLQFPLVAIALDADQDVPHLTRTVVTQWEGAAGTVGAGTVAGGYYKRTWTAFGTNAATSGSPGGGIALDEPGIYLVVVTVDWSFNTSGGRDVWLVMERDGVDVDSTRVTQAPAELGRARQQVSRMLVSEGNETIRVDVQQSSGATLTLTSETTNLQIGRLVA